MSGEYFGFSLSNLKLLLVETSLVGYDLVAPCCNQLRGFLVLALVGPLQAIV